MYTAALFFNQIFFSVKELHPHKILSDQRTPDSICLPFLSGLRFLSTGGGSHSATGIGLLGGVFGLDLNPMCAGGGTCIPNSEKSKVLGVMGM